MTRQVVNGHGVHTQPLDLNEVKIGDTIIFPTIGEKKSEKRAPVLGWDMTLDLGQESAEVLLLNKSKTSIITSKGQSPDGMVPTKLGDWETGFAVVIGTQMTVEGEEKVQAVCRESREDYGLITSRKARNSERSG